MTKAPALLLLALVCGCGRPAPAPRQTQSPTARPAPQRAVPADPPATTLVEIQNVALLEGPVTLRVQWLHGRMRPSKELGIISFDDTTSYVIDVDGGAIAVGSNDLTKLMNQSVFAYPAAPLRNLQVTTQGAQLKVTGSLHKGVDIPIEMLGEVGVTSDGRVRVHAAKLRALHLPVKGFLGVLGLKLADLIDVKRTKGVSVENNDVMLDPTEILPPPHTRGRLSDAHVHGNDLVILYGDARHPVAAAKPVKNYMRFQGGTIRFGKLTMRDADLVMMDSASDAWFYFFLDHYQEQLAAGYSKVTPKSGLLIYMPDYNRLHQAR